MAILDDTRADWNARPPLRALTRVPWSQRIGVSWHWIGPGRGPSSGGPHQKCLDQVRDWQAQHQAKNWKCIGYPALICQHARAIEGRGLDTEGSHSPGVNTLHVGVQFMVGEDGDPPTTAMLARAVRLRADIGALGKNIRRDWAHRDDPEAATGCPGNWIATWVHTGGPTKNAPTSPEEDDMAFTLDQIAEAVWAKQLAKPGNDNTESAGSQLGKAHIFAYRAAGDVAGLEATVAAVVGAIAALPAGASVTPEMLEAALRKVLGSVDGSPA